MVTDNPQVPKILGHTRSNPWRKHFKMIAQNLLKFITMLYDIVNESFELDAGNRVA